MATQTYTLFHPTIWSPRITDYFFANMQAGKFFENFSDLVTEGGNTVRIPTVGNISVSAVDWGTGVVNDSAITDTSVVLDIDRWMSTKRTLSDANYAVMASVYRMRDDMAQSQANSLASFVDKEILDGGADFTNHVGDSTDALGASMIESAIATLHALNIPLKECAFFIHPTPYWATLAKVAKFYDASIYGKARMPGGPQTEIYGIPVYITSNVDKNSAGYRNILAHKTAIAYAVGKLPGAGGGGVQISEKESEHLRKVIYTQILYGVKVRRATGGVRILSRGTA